MRFIPTRTHGLMDYAVGLLLIVAPWLFGFAGAGTAAWLPIILGIGVIGYSLITDYERGAVPILSMPAHLWLDALGGALLVVSPWLFGFSEAVWVPHVVFGILEIGAAAFTQTVPGRGPTRGRGRGRTGAPGPSPG